MNSTLRSIPKLTSLRNVPYFLTLAINAGIYADYHYNPDRSLVRQLVWLHNHTVSLHSFALSEGDIRPLILSSFSHVHPLHLLVNTIGLAYANVLLSRVSPYHPITYSVLYFSGALGSSLYFLSDQWTKTITRIQLENPLLYQNVIQAIDDYKRTYFDMKSNGNRSNSGTPGNEDMVTRSEANEKMLESNQYRSHMDKESPSSLTNEQAAILAFKQQAVIEAFRTAIMATPSVYPILNSAGLGASGVIMGMLTYSSLRLLLQYRRPGLAIYMSMLMAIEYYAVQHPDDYELNIPHRYSHRPGEEVSDYPELTRNHTHDKPLVDPQRHRHFVIGHAAHIGGGLTGILIFFLGQKGPLLRTFYRHIVPGNRGTPSPPFPSNGSTSPMLRSLLSLRSSTKTSIGLLAVSSLTERSHRTIKNKD